MRRWPSALRCSRLSRTPRSLSKTTSPATLTPGSASPIVTVATSLAIDSQPPLAGPIGTTTRPSTRWSTRRRASSSSRAGLAVGVGHERAAFRLVELALDRAHELLVPEVGQAADEQADDGGRAAGQRAGDRVGLVAQLRGGLAHAPLGLGRDLHAAQRVAHGGR